MSNSPQDRPGSLSPEWRRLAQQSPDAASLPTSLDYDTLFEIPNLTHRDRRQAMLLLGVDGGLPTLRDSADDR